MAADPRNAFRPTGAELVPLLDGLATCVLWLDADGVVLHLNEPAEDLLEQSRNQAVGRRHPRPAQGQRGTRGRHRAGPRGGRTVLASGTAVRDGSQAASPRFVDLTVTPYDAPGHPGGAIVEIADVTQHQRILRENALLTQLGGSRAMVRQLAHEIKNPLGGLRGAAQLLERQLKDPRCTSTPR